MLSARVTGTTDRDMLGYGFFGRVQSIGEDTLVTADNTGKLLTLRNCDERTGSSPSRAVHDRSSSSELDLQSGSFCLRRESCGQPGGSLFPLIKQRRQLARFHHQAWLQHSDEWQVA